MVLFTLEPWQLAVLIAPAFLNLWGIWHAWKHTFPSPEERAYWMALCVFIPLIGGLAYLMVGRRRVVADNA